MGKAWIQRNRISAFFRSLPYAIVFQKINDFVCIIGLCTSFFDVMELAEVRRGDPGKRLKGIAVFSYSMKQTVSMVELTHKLAIESPETNIIY